MFVFFFWREREDGWKGEGYGTEREEEVEGRKREEGRAATVEEEDVVRGG